MTKIITTLGPATSTFEKISMIKNKGVDFVRINLSHSSISDLEKFIMLAKKANISFIIDTEGSQVRTGKLKADSYSYCEGDKITLHKKDINGDKHNLCIRPKEVIGQLEEGDILYIDFDTLVIRIMDVSKKNSGVVKASIISSGSLGQNKGVVIDSKNNNVISIPTLTNKDIDAIKLGLKYNIKHVAASFMRNKTAVDYVRKISKGKMFVISKIECVDAIYNLDEIIEASDFILIDRGDLSKEIPIERIPFTQKIIIERSKRFKTGVFVATNLLESMIVNRKPTRAEVHDITNTIIDGAYGLTLAAETAIGKYPLGCINMLKKIINHTNRTINPQLTEGKEKQFVNYLEKNNYLVNDDFSEALISPHGGTLVDRLEKSSLNKYQLKKYQKLRLNENQKLDFEQIAVGTYSPLKGFMTKLELESVLDNLCLPDGNIWTIPILLDLDETKAEKIKVKEKVVLVDEFDEIIGTMTINDKFIYDKNLIIKKLYGSNDQRHPGVNLFNSL